MSRPRIALALLCLFAAPGWAWAQATATTGQIEGTIVDETGGALPGVTVSARNVNTGFERSTASGGDGIYRLSLLPLGTYELTAELQGFTTVKRGGLILHVNETLTVPVQMKVATVQETITVTAESPLVEVSRSQVANTINETAIDSLPINGRRFQDFVLLTPGAVFEGQRGGTSINGQRGINAAYAIDGASYDNPFFGGIKGGERSNVAYTISQEAISEFQVSNSGYTAEFGRSGGGVVNAVTKTGTNELHGGGFWFFRDERMQADDPFGRPPTDFRQHQFGLSLGGPVKRDRVHFFGVYDQQVRDNPLVVKFSANPAGIPRFDGQESTFKQTNDVWTAFGRVDTQINSDNHFWIRYNWSRNEGKNGLGSTPTRNAIGNNSLEKDRTNTVVAQFSTILTPTRLNEVRFQYGREDRPREPNTTDVTVTVTGLGTAGRVTFLPSLETDARYQVVDNFTWLAGKHSLRAGTDINLTHTEQPFFLSRSGGEYRFRSVADYLATVAGQPRYQDFRQGFGRPDVDFWQKEYAFYVQDTWKIESNMTLNYGLRYEAQIEPQPDAPNSALPESSRIPSDKNNWGPRLGLTWDPWKDNKGVVRFNAGLFYSRTPALLLVSPFTNTGAAQLQITFRPGDPGAPTFPNILSAPPQLASAPRTDVNFFSDPFNNPRTFQGTIGVEREVLPNLTFSVDVTHARMRHLERLRDVNLPPPAGRAADGRLLYVTATNPRPNRNFQRMLQAEDSSKGAYWGVTFAGRKRWSGSDRWYNRGLQFQAFYTYGQSKDDDSNERNFSGTFYQDWQNLAQEYTWSANDVRHNFVMNGTWTLAGDVQIGAIVVSRTGTPYSRTSTSDINGNGTFDDDRQFIDGRDTGRNSFRHSKFGKLDVRITKAFRFAGRQTVDIGVDVFNALDNENFFVSSRNRNFLNNPNVGIPDSQSGDPRTGQISLRYRF